MSERTFLAIKPDGVQRGLVAEIVKRFEQRGYQLVAMKFLVPARELVEQHYAEHRERPFFGSLVEFLISGPVVAMVWQGANIVANSRKMIGATKPADSAPGTIRGDLAIDLGSNIIHGSDSVESAQREINLWFKADELVDWKPTRNQHLY